MVSGATQGSVEHTDLPKAWRETPHAHNGVTMGSVLFMLF